MSGREHGNQLRVAQSNDPRTRQSRYWCFTLNGWGCDDVLKLRSLGRDADTSVYLVFGREGRLAPHTSHLQGYCEFVVRCRKHGAKLLLGHGTHVEARNGTAEQAARYCRKEGDFEEFGRMLFPSGGTRTDLNTIRRRIEEGFGEVEIASEYFPQWVVYRRSFAAYRNLLSTRGIRRDLRVHVIYGRPGTGKTRLAYEFEPGLYACVSPSLQWFDGYVGQRVCLIDDFRGGEVSASFLLRLLDIYPLEVPTKGGFCRWIPERIFITTNESPPFGLVGDTAIAFRRRVASIRRMDTNLDFTDVSLIKRIMDMYK